MTKQSANCEYAEALSFENGECPHVEKREGRFWWNVLGMAPIRTGMDVNRYKI